MIKLQIQTHDKKGVEYITLPENLKEIKLRNFTEFEAAFEEKQKLFEKIEELSNSEFNYCYIKAIVNCLKAVDLNRVDKLKLGNLQEHLHSLYKSNNLNTKQVEKTLLGIFAHIYKVIKSYKIKKNWSRDYVFFYKGDKYKIKGGYLDYLTGQQKFYEHTTAQVVEALDIVRHYQKSIKNDPKGDFKFTCILYLIACFAFKEGEKFPSQDLEIKKFISERVTFFQDVDMEVGLDVHTFFLHTRKQYKTTQV